MSHLSIVLHENDDEYDDEQPDDELNDLEFFFAQWIVAHVTATGIATKNLAFGPQASCRRSSRSI